ncbi:MAG: HypC/HybG/HupF family hydrogenase formation chaperone [Vitreoscilla sp.]|nr:HypC/HybG/HupF family hydrogenase formation chaperone [Vitreoscilla sp.]
MCLALPARVVELRDGDLAMVDLGGVRKEISVALTPQAQLGDYVIVHVGHAIGMVDPEEAARTLALFAEIAQAEMSEKADTSFPRRRESTACHDMDSRLRGHDE